MSEVKFLRQIGGEWCQGVKIFWKIMGHIYDPFVCNNLKNIVIIK